MKKLELIREINSLVGRGVDVDGYYGDQCVDLIMYIAKKWGYITHGNAIDYKYNKLPNGWTRWLGSSDFQAGDVIVWDYGKFGHIGLCVEKYSGVYYCVEQNVNGNMTKGGVATRVKHTDYSTIVAVIRPNYEEEKIEKGEEYMEQIQERYLIIGDYSIDSLPWFCTDRKNIGTTKEYMGYVVTISRKWGNYWYCKFLGGWIDSRAFTKIETIEETKTVVNGSYSVDTLPWGMKGFKTVMSTDELKGKSFRVTAKRGAYLYVHELAKWIDEKAFGIKSIKEIAEEVLEGKWGNGQERKDRLTKAGYNYEEVQREVNKILKK